MFRRYAVYYTPEGALAEHGAAWLGWDLARGVEVAHPDFPGFDVPALTETPRKYGLHGTVKPPFHLGNGATLKALGQDLDALCARMKPVTFERLQVSVLGGFVALTPVGDTHELSVLAARAVSDLDHFRAPADAAELARRRARGLTRSQDENLLRWGYPYVMDDFRFHITLTGRIKKEADALADALQDYFEPHLKAPYKLDSLTLTGEDEDGMFHEISRFSLRG